MRSTLLTGLLAALAANSLAPATFAQPPSVLWSRPLPDRPSALDLSRDGVSLAVGFGHSPSQPTSGSTAPGSGGYHVLSAATGQVQRQLIPYTNGAPNALALSPDRTMLAVAVGDSELRRLSDNVRTQFFPTPSGSAFEIAFNPTGSHVYVGSTPGFGIGVHVYNTATGAETNEFALVNFVAAMGVSPDGRYLAAANDIGNVLVFDVSDPDHEALVLTLEQPNQTEPNDPYASGPWVFDIAFSSDGRTMATMANGRIKVWIVPQGTLVRTLVTSQTFPNQSSGEFFNGIALSADGRTLAAGGYEVDQTFMNYHTNGTLNVWRVSDGAVLGHFEDPDWFTITDVALKADASVLYYAVENQFAQRVEATTLELPPTACPADFDGSGGLSVQDIFEFLSAWFGSDPRADFDQSGGLAVADLFAFLNAWFVGC